MFSVFLCLQNYEQTSPKRKYEQVIKTIQAVTESNEKHIYYKFGNEYILYEKEMLLSYLKKGNDRFEM